MQAGFEFGEPEIKVIAGVDEVGRGPLIGDVVAAAVILPDDCDLPLRDSKKLSESQREILAEEIKSIAVSYSITHVSPQEIDKYNILQATMLAMKQSIETLRLVPDKVMVDGNRCPKIDCLCEPIVKGDDKVMAISAASILAKVARDQQMLALDKVYPEYGFAQHKGYPTKQHLEAIQKLGLPDEKLYRKSFKPVREILSAQTD